ncbi:unnamed protein product, partial [Rotaria socialis]
VRIDLQSLKWFKYNQDLSDWTLTSATPRSFCSEPCHPGEIRTSTDSQQCCWTCRSCDVFHIAINETTCFTCPANEAPNSNFSKCIPIQQEYLSAQDIIAWPALILSSVGILMTIYTIVIFIRFAQTPIIKASSRELSYFLLSGMCCCHLCAWPLIFKPHLVTCFLIRIGVSLSLTICLAALLTKTNRLARIFNNSQRLTQPSCLSPRSQLGICGGIVSIQLIGVLLWIIISPPAIKLKSEIKHNQKRLILVCQTDNEYIACSLVYNMILVISCTLYAIKTRHIPENFNEAKHIGFAMYSVCIIWLAFIPIFFGLRSSDNWFRIQLVSLAICLSLSATVILLCLFAPKLYIVLFNPSKNIHVKFKTTLSSHQPSLERPSTSNNNADELAAANRRRRHTSTDFPTEVSLYASKSDNSALNLNDEVIQTGNATSESGSVFNSACTDAERHHQLQHTFIHDDEATEFLATSNHSQYAQLKPVTSNLVIGGENPWKKLSNVRYKLDENDNNQQNQTSYRHVHAQHITFV